jgi:glycosyltransferase involved in cell wall biosynthesis
VNAGPSRVMLVNKFLHHVGGVETYVQWLASTLREQGLEVGFFGMAPPGDEEVMSGLVGAKYFSPTRSFHGNLRDKVGSALSSIYSRQVAERFSMAMADFRPDLVHLHGTCYQLTPAVERVLQRTRVPSLTTLHEYKLMCSNQRLWNDNRNQKCLLCVGKGTTDRIQNMVATRCVKGSRSASLIASAELPVAQFTLERGSGPLHAPSRFMAELLASHDPRLRDRIRYLDLPWGDPVPVSTSNTESPRGPIRVVYLGRLAPEKGVHVLLDAWQSVVATVPGVVLELHGDGPASDAIRRQIASRRIRNVVLSGRYKHDSVPDILADAMFTVHPSVWPENSPFTVRESLQNGVPAIVADEGGLPEMVTRETGRVFQGGDAAALASSILSELASPRARTAGIRRAVAARAVSDQDHWSGLQELYRESAEIGQRQCP